MGKGIFDRQAREMGRRARTARRFAIRSLKGTGGERVRLPGVPLPTRRTTPSEQDCDAVRYTRYELETHVQKMIPVGRIDDAFLQVVDEYADLGRQVMTRGVHHVDVHVDGLIILQYQT